MILPRPMPLASCRIMSKASISGCAARKASASARVEPEGLISVISSVFRGREKLGQDFGEMGDQTVNLAFRRHRAHEHHIVEGRDQAAPVQKPKMHRRFDGGVMGEA